MKGSLHTFTLDDAGRLHLWNNEPIKRGDKKVPIGYVPSIYLFRCGERIIYVGETSNGVVRCVKGLHNNIKETISYKWRLDEMLREGALECVVFDELDESNLFYPARQREALEAEVAWLIRTETGEWPLLLSKINPSALASRDNRHKILINSIREELCNIGWLTR